MATLRQRLRGDHPAAHGHFPGNPVIPAAVLLSETLALIEAGLGMPLAPYRIRRAKFPHPARPGHTTRHTDGQEETACPPSG